MLAVPAVGFLPLRSLPRGGGRCARRRQGAPRGRTTAPPPNATSHNASRAVPYATSGMGRSLWQRISMIARCGCLRARPPAPTCQWRCACAGGGRAIATGALTVATAMVGPFSAGAGTRAPGGEGAGPAGVAAGLGAAGEDRGLGRG